MAGAEETRVRAPRSQVRDSLADFVMPGAEGGSISQETLRKLDPYFRASVFARFCKDPMGRISTDRLFEYVDKRNAALQVRAGGRRPAWPRSRGFTPTAAVQGRIQLAWFDEDTDGHLQESELLDCLDSVRRRPGTENNSRLGLVVGIGGGGRSTFPLSPPPAADRGYPPGQADPAAERRLRPLQPPGVQV